MANIYYDVRVDISKEQVIESGYRFTAGDSSVIYLRVAVMNGREKFDSTGTTPTIVFKKADGSIVTGTPTLSNDVWVYQIQGTELSAPGRVLCDIKFAYDSGRISSGKFAILVEADTLSGVSSAAKYYVDEYNQLIEESKKNADDAEDAADEASEYSVTAKSWAVGGTNTRTGEDTNNAKYWAEQAQSSSGNNWSTIQNKPFETIGTGLNVDTNGKLNAESSVPGWNDVTGKPFTSIGANLSVDADGKLNAEAGGVSSWSDLTNKPFSTIGDGLSVTDGELSADAQSWDEITSKPFSTIGNNLSVDDGVLNADGGGDASDITYGEITVEDALDSVNNIIADNDGWIKSDNLLITPMENGSFSYNTSTLVFSKASSTTRVRSQAIPLKKGTYTVSATMGNVILYCTKGDKIAENVNLTSWQTLPCTFTITQDLDVYVVFRKSGDATITPSDVTDGMLNVGSSAMDYTPYAPSNTQLQSEIDGLTLTQNTLTTASAMTSYSRIVCEKIGNLKMLEIMAKVTLTASSYVAVAYLPSNCYPSREVIKPIFLDIGNTAYLKIATNGEISLYTKATSFSSSIYINEAFI